jgi:hypothetical protein
MEYLPSRFRQRHTQFAAGRRRVPWEPRRVLRPGTVQRACNSGALHLGKYLSEVCAHGTGFFGGWREDLGDKLDLRTQWIGDKMKTATLIALTAVIAGRFCLAQAAPEQEVLQFERDTCKAFLDADSTALERVLTPGFTLTLSNGEVSTRADEINELRSGKVHYDIFDNYDMLVRLYENNVAVVLGKTRVKGTAEGKPFNHVVQFTDTLIKRDGRWQLAAGHVSLLEK